MHVKNENNLIGIIGVLKFYAHEVVKIKCWSSLKNKRNGHK